MKKKFQVPLFDSLEVDGLVLKILSRNRFGLSAGKIRQDLPPSQRISKGQLAARLNDLLPGGQVHAWHPPAGKGVKPAAPIYGIEPLEALVASEILRLLTNQSLSLAEIKISFPPHIHKHLPVFLDPLLKDRTVKWHPPLKGKRLSLQAPDPANFLSAEIRKLFEKGGRLGFPAEAILQAVHGTIKPVSSKKSVSLTPEETARILFKGMTALKPAAAQGALVYIPDLRKALGEVFADKDSFDQAIMNLAQLEKIQLQSHSLPAELTEEQRQAMIDNGRGSYFMAIGIRME